MTAPNLAQKITLADRLPDLRGLKTAAADYDIVRRAIAHYRGNWRAQPEIETVGARRRRDRDRTASFVPPLVRADAQGFSAGADAQPCARHAALIGQRARRPPTRSACPAPAGCTICSSPTRRCRLANGKSGGEGLTISYGFHPCPFGTALVMTTPRGLCGLGLADPGKEAAALRDMKSRWPKATFVRGLRRHRRRRPQRIFDPKLWRKDRPLRVVLIGTDFEVRVWDKLLKIPMGEAATYSDLADKSARRKAARAVGAAVGKNPICFVVPCHRVIGKSGDITGYHWGSRASARCLAGKRDSSRVPDSFRNCERIFSWRVNRFRN